MRFLLWGLLNLLWLVRAAIDLPFFLLRRRHRPRWVRLKLKGDLPYRAGKKKGRRLGSIEALGRTLETLAADPRVKGAILELEDVSATPAKRAEIARHLVRFRTAKKQLIGHAIHAGHSEYELLCACDRIAMPASGRLDLVGFSAEVSALGGLFERVGIRAEFFRRGDYKTAPELFTHREVSDIQQKVIEGFLDERYRALIEVIAEGRALPPDEARRRIDEGPYSGTRAKAAGLVDELASLTQLEKSLAKAESLEEDEAVGGLDDYARSRLVRRPSRRLRRRPRLDVVRVRGMIVHGEGAQLPLAPRSAGSAPVMRALKAARESPGPAALLYVDSPGGSALASEMILEEAQRLAEKKPLVAFVERVGASGGYMAALAGKELWSAPHAVVGSIGVFAGKFEASQLLERLGVGRAQVKRGERAGLYSPTRPFSDGERAAMDADVEETYQAFLAQVARARKQSVEWVHERAEGRVYSGQRALERGLVDRVGSFEEAAAHALRLGGKDGAFDLLVHPGTRGREAWLETLLPSRRPELFAFWPGWFAFPEMWRDAALVERSEHRVEILMRWMHRHLGWD